MFYQQATTQLVGFLRKCLTIHPRWAWNLQNLKSSCLQFPLQTCDIMLSFFLIHLLSFRLYPEGLSRVDNLVECLCKAPWVWAPKTKQKHKKKLSFPWIQNYLPTLPSEKHIWGFRFYHYVYEIYHKVKEKKFSFLFSCFSFVLSKLLIFSKSIYWIAAPWFLAGIKCYLSQFLKFSLTEQNVYCRARQHSGDFWKGKGTWCGWRHLPDFQKVINWKGMWLL